jgi:NADPH:quinone reductase-like Zn-dependent oxidoreductase
LLGSDTAAIGPRTHVRRAVAPSPSRTRARSHVGHAPAQRKAYAYACARVPILFAGATGVLGRAALPHLRRHHVVGLTRSEEKLHLLRELGADGAVCDVYDYEALLQVAQRVRPEGVVNFVTDLGAGSIAANNRARREGGANLLNVAVVTGASRLVVESVAFTLDGEAGQTIDQLERSALAFPGEALILRFGRLWGAGTAYQAPPRPPAVHVDEAGAQAAALITRGAPGTHTIAGP